jgi:hypothetical protein
MKQSLTTFRLAAGLSGLLLFFGLNACSNDASPEEKDVPVIQDVHIRQRSEEPLDSLLPHLSVYVADITNGEVYVTVKHRDHEIGSGYLYKGAEMEVPVKKGCLSVKCTELLNHLIGEDYADLKITFTPGAACKKKPDAATTSEIEPLLQDIRDSKLTFIRNGEGYSGKEFAAVMEMKWQLMRDKVHTKEEFIREIGTVSDSSGEDYLVRLENGSEMRMADWLVKQ